MQFRPDGVIDSRASVFDAALDAIITIDHRGQIIEFNAAAEQTFGWSRAQACGRMLAETIIPERFRAAHTAGLHRYLETGEVRVLGRRIEVAALRVDGSEFPAELAITRVAGSEPPLFTGFIRDLTDRQRLDRRRSALYHIGSILADAESLEAAAVPLLKAVVEAFDGAIAALWVVDADFMRCAATYRAPWLQNDAFERITQSMRFAPGVGLPGRVWKTADVHWIENVLEDDNLPRLAAALEQNLHAAFGFPIRIGADVAAMIEVFLPRTSGRDDDLVRLVGSIGHQIGQFMARQRAETDRARLLVQERQLRLAAEQASRAKDEFLAILSHELRTPLNAVLGWITILKSASLPEAKRQRAIDAIERGTRSQAQLIEDLLDVTRIIHGKLTIAHAPIDAAAVIRAAVDIVQPSAQERDVRLVMERVDVPVRVFADRSRLQQIVWNLLTNAVKFTPAGGDVTVILSSNEDSLAITVRDTGVGIRSELLPHLFERFRQGDSSATRTVGGLGLGLAIVRHLVELHGGGVRAASEGENRGSTFTVTLPVDPRRQEYIAPP